MTLGYPTNDMVLGLKGQGHRVTKCKNIEGDGVAGMSLHLYRVSSAYPLVILISIPYR